MSFSTLPPELKLSIIAHLDPGSTCDFARTSKAHLDICKEILRDYARLSAQYSTITPSYDSNLICDLTREILQDSQKAWFVRDLNLLARRPERIENMSEDDKTLFKIAAETMLSTIPSDSTFFNRGRDGDPGSLNDGMDNIAEGFEDPVLVILIHHLPRLRTIRMTVTGDGYLASFLRCVASGYQDPTLASRMPLQQLKTAAVAHYDTEFGCSVDWAVYFMCIPSLRTFAAFSMGSEDVRDPHDEDGEGIGDGEAHLHNTAGVPVSNVEHLAFHNCQFDPQSLNLILSMTKNLKKFEYDAGGHVVAYQDYEPRRVIKALAKHVSHSLEELQLAESQIGFEEGENDIPFVSAREFKKLKALQCEARWLLRLPNDDVGNGEALSEGFFTAEESGDEFADPRDNLPESLEYLWLDGVYEDEEWEEMKDIFGTTNACTPKLTLDNSCVSRHLAVGNGNRSHAKYGRAIEPHVKFHDPDIEDIWEGRSW